MFTSSAVTPELLYVGYTRWLKRRLYEHRRYKAWWPEVTETRSEEFATEDAARAREKELWAGGRPKYNRQTPFLTAEERFKRSPQYGEYLAGERARNRRRQQTPEGRARGGKFRPQTGPGLF